MIRMHSKLSFFHLQSVAELNQQLVAAESDGGMCISVCFGSGAMPLVH